MLSTGPTVHAHQGPWPNPPLLTRTLTGPRARAQMPRVAGAGRFLQSNQRRTKHEETHTRHNDPLAPEGRPAPAATDGAICSKSGRLITNRTRPSRVGRADAAAIGE